MKLHGIKLLGIGGLVLVVSAMALSRVSTSVDLNPAQPQLATLASLHKRSDPYALTTAFKPETQMVTAATHVESTAEPSRNKTYFSAYVWLHVTRADNLLESDDID